MKYHITTIILMLALISGARGATIQSYGTMPSLASGDYFVADDVSDTSADATGTTKKVPWSLIVSTMATATQTLSGKTIDGGANTLTGIASTSFVNADWGAITLSSGVATVDADSLTAAMMADGDWGGFTISSNLATLDDDTVLIADMANGDWGSFSISSNVATVDDDALSAAMMADGDWGVFTVATNLATIDDDTLVVADMANGDWGAFTITSNAAALDDDVVAAADIADGDWGIFSVATNVASLDADGLTSANVASAVSDETGSGAVVLGTSPTITSLTAAGLTVTGKHAHAGQEITLGAASTTFAVTSNFVVVTGDAGTNTLATITGGIQGMRVTLLFADALVTITNTDAHTANTVDLSAAFTSADDKVLEIIFDGTSWYEVTRSTN